MDSRRVAWCRGLYVLLMALGMSVPAAGQSTSSPESRGSTAAIAYPRPSVMATDPRGRPAGASVPSIGDVPELVFAKSCESGLCPMTSLDFGTVTAGSSGPHSEVWLLNQSDSATATGLTFLSDPEFPVFSPTNSCLLVIPPELPPGGSCRLAVKFAPTTAGPTTGNLTATSAEGAEAGLTLTGTGDTSEVVLYGQFHDWETMHSSFGLTNAVYADDPEFNAELADDFLVEDPDGWTVSRVGLEIFSVNFSMEIVAVDVQFMPDAGGVPGEIAICSAPDSQAVFWDHPNEDRRMEIALSSPCVLPPGHYWLRARPTVSSFFNDNTFWGLQYLQGTEEEPPGEPPVHLNPPVWRNPSGVHGFCPEWTHIYPPDCSLEDWFPFLLAYDAIFWLIGQVGEVSAPDLVFDPADLDFGDVEVGASEMLSASLRNTGNAPATGLSFSDLPEAFTADTGGCGSSLGAGENCPVAVTFIPLAAGLASAELQVASTELVSASLDLAGNGVPTGDGFTPIALEVDPEPFLADGNGVFEPGELVEVAPSWLSEEITATPLAGTASEFGGDGGVYFLALNHAEYGTVEPGATASCRDMDACYFMAVGPSDRPVAHWEATFDETLSDGTTHTWSLHIGESFTDVPRSNPFYTAVETLFHHGVTGGCGEARYCPAGANTRGQMALFLLKAAEDDGYVPPACTEDAERFADVPFDHPLCPWIEELAKRGVTAGCGNGNYCPGAPVSRAQMAVFLLKAFEGDGYTPQACTGVFSDIDCPSAFANWIEELASRGVTGGCGSDPPTYCPTVPVTRAQMAAFVSRTFGLTLYGP